MTKKDSESYQLLCDMKDKEIELLKFKLDNKERMQNAECCECERGAIQKLIDMNLKIQPFEDEYFKGLTYEQIAELAKKSIRITTENRELEGKLDGLEELLRRTDIENITMEDKEFFQYFYNNFMEEAKKILNK